jgi:hypothetical protein
VWIEERLVSALAAPVGTRLRLGDAELEVGAVLTLEPERSSNFFNFAPRLLMNAADVPASGLIRPGSRASYYLYFAGAPAELKAAKARSKPRSSAASAWKHSRPAGPKCAPRSSGHSAFSRSPRCSRRSSPAWRSPCGAALRAAPPRCLRGHALPRRDAIEAGTPLRR